MPSSRKKKLKQRQKQKQRVSIRIKNVVGGGGGGGGAGGGVAQAPIIRDFTRPVWVGENRPVAEPGVTPGGGRGPGGGGSPPPGPPGPPGYDVRFESPSSSVASSRASSRASMGSDRGGGAPEVEVQLNRAQIPDIRPPSWAPSAIPLARAFNIAPLGGLPQTQTGPILVPPLTAELPQVPVNLQAPRQIPESPFRPIERPTPGRPMISMSPQELTPMGPPPGRKPGSAFTPKQPKVERIGPGFQPGGPIDLTEDQPRAILPSQEVIDLSKSPVPIQRETIDLTRSPTPTPKPIKQEIKEETPDVKPSLSPVNLPSSPPPLARAPTPARASEGISLVRVPSPKKETAYKRVSGDSPLPPEGFPRNVPGGARAATPEETQRPAKRMVVAPIESNINPELFVLFPGVDLPRDVDTPLYMENTPYGPYDA